MTSPIPSSPRKKARRFSSAIWVRQASGYRVRLGKVGIDERDDVVEGVVLLQRGERRCRCWSRSIRKSRSSTRAELPGGVAIKTFYDRTVLIHTTIETVIDILIAGIILVSIILLCIPGAFPDAQ